MAISRGLNKGRGLSALIPQKKAAASPAAEPGAKTPAAAETETKEKVAETARAAAPQSKESAKTAKPGKTAKKGQIATNSKNKGKKKPIKTTSAKETANKKDKKPTLQKPAPAEKAASAPANASANESVQPSPAVPAPAKAPVQAEPDSSAEKKAGILSVRLTEVVPSRKQPRKIFEEEPIRELAESIKEHGILTPLLVRKKGDYYELIAGERRWRAAKLAGLKEVPVILHDFSEQEAMEVALIDNLQREDLNAIEEARAYQSLIDEFYFTQEELAVRVSKSRAAVTNALRLLKLDEAVQNMLIEGALTMGHARALLALGTPEEQRLTAERVKAAGLSVRETEKLVRRLQNPKKAPRKTPQNTQLDTILADLEEQLRKSLGTQVKIQPLHGKKGKVEIEYYSNEDLERILDRLR